MSGSSFTNVFGGAALRPAQPSYLALTIAADTALVWPLETTEGQPVVATQLDITASTGGLNLLMPPGSTGSTGVQSIVSNVGSDTFTVTDQAGNPITPIATTETWLITLIDNTTANGAWRAVQIGATVSQATAAALAGLGLQANGSLLQINWPTTTVNGSGAVHAAARSTLLNWTGATGTLQFDGHAALGVGFICAFANNGTGALTFSCTGGDTINGAGTLVVQPGSSGFIICNASGFLVVGARIGVLPITEGGTGATTANAALTNLGGTSTGVAIFTAPSVAAVVALLGLSVIDIVEATVSTDQVLTPSTARTAFVCTAPLVITLPFSNTVTTAYSFLVFAHGGDVSLSPQAADTVNGGGASIPLIMSQGTSAYVFTDAAGAWWAFFIGLPFTGGTLSGGLTIDAGGLLVNSGGIEVVSGGMTIDAGGMTVDAGGLMVAGGAGITGGFAASGGGLFDVLFVTAPGTASTEVVNFSQFGNTLAADGVQVLPGGLMMQWGTGATTAGSGTIAFTNIFPTACLNVQLTINGAAAPASQHPLLAGALAPGGFPVFGDAGESLGFYWFATGH